MSCGTKLVKHPQDKHVLEISTTNVTLQKLRNSCHFASLHTLFPIRFTFLPGRKLTVIISQNFEQVTKMSLYPSLEDMKVDHMAQVCSFLNLVPIHAERLRLCLC